MYMRNTYVISKQIDKYSNNACQEWGNDEIRISGLGF